jgi:tripartite-type tricarboxylate transporter receptor subunit TctC
MIRTNIQGRLVAGLLASAAMIATAQAHDPAAPERSAELFQPGTTGAAADAAAATGRPPLYEGLGSSSMPITAADPTA